MKKFIFQTKKNVTKLFAHDALVAALFAVESACGRRTMALDTLRWGHDVQLVVTAAVQADGEIVMPVAVTLRFYGEKCLDERGTRCLAMDPSGDSNFRAEEVQVRAMWRVVGVAVGRWVCVVMLQNKCCSR